MREAARVLLAVAHQDDETIGAGILLSRTPDAWVIHATDGVPREAGFIARGFSGSPEEYAAARQRELEASLALAGIGSERLRCLCFQDQGVVFEIPRLTRELAAAFREIAPEIVLTHAYEGGHTDHDAVALAVHAAADLLRGEDAGPPEIWEMALYHAEPGENPERRMVVGELLPGPRVEETRIVLTQEERELKRRMLGCFETQRETLQAFFPPRDERFRPAPRYDFTKPPHEGRLQYEIWGFGMTGERWRDVASGLQQQLCRCTAKQ
jgi:N-acetylglucosamine malate deacetylase 2